MSVAQAAKLYHLNIRRPDDFEAWRQQARAMVAAHVPPERILWSVDGQEAQDLFEHMQGNLPPPSRAVRASTGFLRLAASVILHRNPQRFTLLYQLLWRLQMDPHLLKKAADPDVHRLNILAGQIRRDIHKMRAFVRFRVTEDADGVERYVAWFEPDHHILRANADFFLNRFASQRWSILTPDLCLHWDRKILREATGANRQDAPDPDAAEHLWQRYYASIFNPARLKVSMMMKEMPRRYWKNLPEARLIPELIAGAQAREAAMVARGRDQFPSQPPASFEEIAQGIASCRRCPIGCNGTRAVAGEGPTQARLLIVGEQPGDQEERAGRPFVGPAGQLLTQHLEEAGFDRSQIRITNAVKHFKYQQRGTQRIHQNPTADEIDRCRWWLDAERQLGKPDMILALGASAGRALLGRTPAISAERGRMHLLPDGGRLWLTIHPSYLLRLTGAAKTREQTLFQHDLRQLWMMWSNTNGRQAATPAPVGTGRPAADKVA